MVVMDVAGEYAMYASDITRTAPANGKFTARQREIYDIVLGAQQAAIKAFQVGRILAVRRRIRCTRSPTTTSTLTAKTCTASRWGSTSSTDWDTTSGLNVHDVGDNQMKLGPGMVFTIEPGIYIPEEKIGVRIEDIFWVDPNGKLVDLTASLPHTADEVEAAMAECPQITRVS